MAETLELWRDQIASAASGGEPICIHGGNSKAFYGQTPVGEPLDTRAHHGVVTYEPSELVVTARAGTPLAELEATLAEQGQMLAFEPPHFGQATVGGCVAAGLAGPRRARVGGVRDYVLGAQLLDGNGKLLNFGGQVMKNVAGYDISRFLAGSLGMLGVITEVSLKVLPVPECELTLRLSLDLESARDAMRSWAARPVPVSATAWNAGELHLRLSGGASAVEAAAQSIGGERLTSENATELWQQLREQRYHFFTNTEAPLWRLALPTTAELPIGDLFNEEEVMLEWNCGQCWLLSNPPASAIREFASRAGGHATLFRGGDRTGHVFTPLPDAAMALQRNLKAVFDPAGVFNPGRMYPSL